MRTETDLRDAMSAHAQRAVAGDEIRAALEVSRPEHGRSRGRLVGLGAAAVVLAGAISVGYAASDTTPAYAVTENSDGTVTVTIEDIKAIDPANATLRKLGIRVKAVPETSDCVSLESLELYQGPDWNVPTTLGDAVTVDRSVPAGYTVLLTVSGKPGRGNGLGFTAPVKDPAPSCLLDPASDPSQR